MRELKTTDEYQSILNNSDGLFVLMKHSNSCATSQSAFQEIKRLSKKNKIQVYYCVVQKSRKLSNYIEHQTNIKHQSPQALIMKNKEVLEYFNHLEIDEDSLYKSIMKY